MSDAFRVALDFDGVIHNFNHAWQRIAERDYGRVPVLRQSEWHPVEKDGRDYIGDIMKGDEVWHSGKPYPGVLSSVRDLTDRGIEFYIVTTVPAHAVPHRLDWIADHEVPHAGLFITAHSAQKVEAAQSFDADAAIDDNQDNARAYRDAGITSFLLARPWNREEDGLCRVTWRQLPLMLRALKDAKDHETFR